jgi:hypothetical protein
VKYSFFQRRRQLSCVPEFAFRAPRETVEPELIPGFFPLEFKVDTADERIML